MKGKLLLWILPPMAYILVRILGITWRISVENPHSSPTPDKNKNEKIIFAFWHNRLAVHTYYYRHCDVTAMISQSKDGEYIARLARLFGHSAVRGSTSKDSKKAMAELVQVIKDGKNATITPDGPRGPKYKLQPGVIEIARMSGAKIVPMAFGSSRSHLFKSWDGFILPKFFSRIVICFGKPIDIPDKTKESNFDEFRKMVEKELMKTTERSESIT